MGGPPPPPPPCAVDDLDIRAYPAMRTARSGHRTRGVIARSALSPPPPQPPPSPPLRLPAAERAAAGAPKAYRAEHVMPRPRHGVAHAPCAARHAICGRSPAQSPSATCRIPCIALQRGATVKPPSPRHQLGSGHELAPFTRAHARSSAPLPLPPPRLPIPIFPPPRPGAAQGEGVRHPAAGRGCRTARQEAWPRGALAGEYFFRFRP